MKAKRIAGIVLTVVAALMLGSSAIFKLMLAPNVIEGFTKFGFAQDQIRLIGVIELSVLILYLIPATSVFGALLVLAYLGGATVTHLRAHEVQLVGPILVGVAAFLGLWLREPRLWSLLPLRKPQ